MHWMQWIRPRISRTYALHAEYMGQSSMRCSDDLLDKLHEMKERGESYEDVVWRLIDSHEGGTEETRVDEREEALQLDDVEIDVPGSGDLERRRTRAIEKMAELLREEGTAEKQDFLELVDPDDVGYASRDSFWSNVVKGRESLKAISGVEPPSTGRTEWTWNDSP